MKNRLLLLILAVVLAVSPATAPAQTYTPVLRLVTTSGTVASGARKLVFIFSADFTGTIEGVAFAGATDSSISFEAPSPGILGPVTYTVTAGSFRLVQIR